MRRSVVQRSALLVLAVCFAAFLGLRLASASHDEAHHADGHATRDTHHETSPEGAHGLVQEAAQALGVPSRSARDEVYYEQSFPLRAGDRLEVGLTSEDVVIETGRASGATVTVLGRGRDADEEFSRRRFSADYQSGTLEVRTDPQRRAGFRGNVRASFTVVVTLPEQADLALATASGDVTVDGPLNGTLSLNTASGDVILGRVEAAPSIEINTASGDIQAELFDADRVAVSTASGDVTLERLAAGPAAFSSASGDVSIAHAGAERLAVSTSSGDVSLGTLDAPLSAETGSGDVSANLSQAHAVTASTGSGDVELGLPGAGFDLDIESGDVEMDDALRFVGQRERRSVEGRLGAGGPMIRISTGGGSVALERG